MIWLMTLALAGEPRVITLEDALKASAEANPSLRRTEIAIEQAAADLRAARGVFDPTLRIDGGWDTSQSFVSSSFLPEPIRNTQTGWNLNTTLSATAPTGTGVSLSGDFRGSRNQGLNFAGVPTDRRVTDETFSVGLTQELLRGIRLGYNLQKTRTAREGMSIAELELEKARSETEAATAKAYWMWVQQVRLAEIARASVAVAEEALRVGAAKVDAGELAPLERTRLEAALVQARTSALDATDAAQQASDALLVLMGEAPGTALEPGSAVGDPPIVNLDPIKVAETAIAQNLDLTLTRARIDSARYVVTDSRHQLWPTLQARVDGGVTATQIVEEGVDDQSAVLPQIAVGGTFTVPLGNRAASGQLQRASAQVALLQTTLVEQEHQLRADVERQVRVLTAARQKVDLADMNVRLAEETLRSEEALQAAGRSILKDVLEARDGVSKAQAEAVRARTEVRVAEVELGRLVGVVGEP